MKIPFNLFFLILCIILIHSSFISPLCLENERTALLQFKLSVSINQFASVDPSAYPKTETWKPAGNGIDCCLWDGIECSEKGNHVISLDLSSSYLYGMINSNSTLFELEYLETLNLADNDFRYSLIPSKINNLLNLKYLNLSRSLFSGRVPTEISELSHLISLDLSYNVDRSSGANLLNLGLLSLKSPVQGFTNLKVLNLNQVSISSRVLKVLANFTSLRLISLNDCGLHRAFPKDIFLLPYLESLNIAGNINLVGQLLKFHNNSKLQVLILKNTGFFGKIPASIGNLGSLTELNIINCSFEGVIPDSLGKLTQLKTLTLTLNNFRGQIPSSLGNLTQLLILGLSCNQLISEIPSSLANLTKLTILDLGDNMLHGSFPSWIARLENLKLLDLLENSNLYMLAGPVDFGMFMKLKQLQFLGLSNVDLILPIKYNTSHQFLVLSLNACNLTQLPSFLQNQTKMEILSLEYNGIRGSIHIPSPFLMVYDVTYNELSGEIPPLICNLTSLDQLKLGHNKLSGALPPCFGNLSNSLSILELQENNFQGAIPDTFTTKCQLKWIILSSNQFQGKVPRSLANCSSLEVLNLGNNQISDAFPIWPQGLPNLHALVLGSNRLHGVIAHTFGLGFPKLQIIDLSNNQLEGNLSSDTFLNWYAMRAKGDAQQGYIDSAKVFSKLGIFYLNFYFIKISYKGAKLSGAKVLNIFISIDLSCNNFGGEIPDSIGNLVGLQSFNLSHNNLNGGIPSSLGSISNLESLDLAYNMFSGDIPQELTALTFLEIFNVSYNKLTGVIPQDNQFSTFENDSYEGNTGLCGNPLSRKCGKDKGQSPSQPQTHLEDEEGEESSTLVEWIVISMGFISGLLVGAILGQIITTKKHEWFMEIVRRMKCNQQDKKRKNSQS